MATDTGFHCWENTPGSGGNCSKPVCPARTPSSTSSCHSSPSIAAIRNVAEVFNKFPNAWELSIWKLFYILMFTTNLIMKYCSGNPVWTFRTKVVPATPLACRSLSASQKLWRSVLNQKEASCVVCHYSGPAAILLLTSGLSWYVLIWALWKRASDWVSQSPCSLQHSSWSVARLEKGAL